MARDDGDQRIQTWTAIGVYIGRDARTAQRYGRTGGLPVRRLADARGSAVYAFRSELDAWLSGRREGAGEAAPQAELSDRPLPAPPVGPAPNVRRPRRVWAAAGLVLALAAAGAAAVALRPPAARRAPSADVLALYQNGVYAWSRRTPEGLARAIDAFTQAVVRDPGFAPAYAGLADAYDLAPEYGRLSPAQAYPRAKSAAERALALDPSSAEAHRALAFVKFWWEGRVDAAMAEFRRALALDPHAALTHHWYGNALAARNDPRALDELDAALRLAPSTPVMEHRAWALVVLGRPGEALATLAELRRLDTLSGVKAVDVFANRRLGRDGDMLKAMLQWSRARGDEADARTVEHLQAVYAKDGRAALLQGLADREEARLAQGRGDAFQTAEAEARRGRGDVALTLLQRAEAEHLPQMLNLSFSPDFASLRSNPQFRSLAR